MNENNGESGHSAPLPNEASPSPVRGHVLLAWLAILLMSGAVIFWQNVGRKGPGAAQQLSSLNRVVFEFQAKLFVAIPEFVAAAGKDDPNAVHKARQELARQVVETLERGSVDERLSSLILLGEFDGPRRARQGISDLTEAADKAGHEWMEAEKRHVDILTRLYTDYADERPTAPTVSPDERKELVDAFGWIGELALAPAIANEAPTPQRSAVLDEANRVLAGGVSILLIVIAAFAVGLVGLTLLAILALKGRWKSQLGPAVAHHGVYAETFSLWFALYWTLSFVAQRFAADWLSPLVGMSAPMILSLAALAWPVWRGVAWRQVRQDVGLTLGRQPLLEPTFGFVSYMNALPLVVAGALLVLILKGSFQGAAAPAEDPFQPAPTMAHPLIQQLRDAAPSDILPLFFLMCVCAPIMEEIMFRGVLYRHLRDATRPWTFGVLISVLGVSLVFAAVHPQGLLAIPILASLACGFVLAREWRGTLIPAMIAHGLNNSLILAVGILCLMK